MKNSEMIHQQVLHYAYTDKDKLFQDFHISETGYNDEQVKNSLDEYGQITFEGQNNDTILYRLRRAFINPFTVILMVLVLISFVTDVLLSSNFSRNMTTVIIILCMILISGIIRFIQEMRSKKIADHLASLLHSTVMVKRNGKWITIASSKLVVGDMIKVFSGDRIPGDIRLIKTNDLFVSQSIITGESDILEKDSQTMTLKNPQSYSEYHNIAFMGSIVTGGSGIGIVLALGRSSVYGGFSKTKFNRKNGFDQGANSIACVLIRFMIILVPIVFIACGLTKGNWASAFLFALSIAVGLTPEMLPMVSTACLAKGSATLSQKQTLVKNINAMQGFGSMDVLCVDKTGTLTGDTILLEYYMDILGNENHEVLDFAYLNSLYHNGITNHLDSAILQYQKMPGKEEHFKKLTNSYQKIDVLPFDYKRKLVSVLVNNNQENLIIVKGAVDEVYQRCSYVEYQGNINTIDANNTTSVHAVIDDMLEDGMKVLAVAYKPTKQQHLDIDDEHDLILMGYLAFFDAPKRTATAAISKLKKLHVDIKVLTGDHRDIAISICRRLGIDTKNILTGQQLASLAEDIKDIQIEKTTIFAELSPKQKALIVSILQSNGHTVGFMGDGINDAAAMKAADIGISVDTAVDIAKESADIILLEKNLMVLEEGIIEGRKTYANMIKYIKMTASSNFGNMFSVLAASALLPFLPMMSVHLIFLNLIYDLSCSAIPWDNVDEEYLKTPR